MTPPTRDRPAHEPARHLAAVIAVQQEIATADRDLAHLMTLVTRRAMELTHASGAVVEMLEGDEMVYHSVAGMAEPHVGLRLRVDSSISGLCVRLRQVLRVDDTETDDRVDRAACRRVGTRAMIVMPLMFRDHAVGVLKVLSADPAWFREDDATTLQLMAGLISAAMAHAQAFEAQSSAARRRSAELESLLDNAPLGVAFLDREHRYTRINKRLADLNHRSPDEHLGRTVEEVLGAYGKQFDELVERVFRTREPVEHELSARFGPDDERHWLCAFFPMFVEGELQLVGTYLVDLTARKRGERELQRTLSLLDAIMTASTDGIYVKDRESRLQYANRATLELIGKSTEEVLGKTDAEFLGVDGERIIENDRRVMATGEPETIEELVHQPAGTRVFLSSKSPHRAANGEIVGLVGISKEITERKLAEQRLHGVMSELETHRAQLEAVFQSVQDGIVVFDRTGKVVLLNESEARICGFASADEMRRDLDYFAEVFEIGEIGGPLLPVERWPVSRVFGGESLHEWQLRGRRTDTGQEWFFSFSGEPVRDEHGEVAMAVLITRDITAHKRAELGLREAVRARDEFVSVASHELKTPLTSLQLQIEGLRRALSRRSEDGVPDDRIRKFTEQTSRQTARLGQLVDDMLDLSRIATGKFRIDPAPMDLAATVSDVIERLRPQLEAANGEVRLDLREPVPGSWDRERIEQVLSNLLTNAMRYGKGAAVEVGLRRTPELAELTVTDHGVGIAPEDLARIFERFERAISASEVSGLGLGLFISRQIVEAHRGRIWVESELGKGATFHVELPLYGASPSR